MKLLTMHFSPFSCYFLPHSQISPASCPSSVLIDVKEGGEEDRSESCQSLQRGACTALPVFSVMCETVNRVGLSAV